MDFSRNLTRQLNALTAALDGSGDDLTTILNLLVEDLTAAIASFVGLIITVTVDNEPITVMAMNSHAAATSMMLPLAPGSDTPGGSPSASAVLYARNPGAFVDLAADSQIAVDRTGVRVVLDEHLPPPTAADAELSIGSLEHRSVINQAVGVLIEQGYPPPRARTEIGMRAAAAGVTTVKIAQTILDQLGSGGQPDLPLDDADDEDDPDERAG